MLHRWLRYSPSALVLVLAACAGDPVPSSVSASSSGTTEAGGSGTGGSGAGGSGAGGSGGYGGGGAGSGGACELTLLSPLPKIAVDANPAEPPAPQGGALVPGNYALKQIIEYRASPPSTQEAQGGAIAITTTTFEHAIAGLFGDPDYDSISTYTLDASKSQIQTHCVCASHGACNDKKIYYTANGSELMIYGGMVTPGDPDSVNVYVYAIK